MIVYSESNQFEAHHELEPPDAIIYASVLAHINKTANTESCFLTRDAKGFAEPSVRDELKNFNCRLISRFDHGLEFVKSHLEKHPQG